MSNRPKIGGRRQPPGGRPPKGNVKFYLYLPPDAVEQFDSERGALTRGEFFMLVWANWKIDQSNVTSPPRGARSETEETTMHNHNCHYVGPVAEGSPVCRSKATKAIVAVSDEQGKRLQAYSCDDHAEPTRAYFERIGHKQVAIEPIRS